MKTIKEFMNEVLNLSKKYLDGREVSVYTHYPNIDHYKAVIHHTQIEVEYNFILEVWQVKLKSSSNTISSYLEHKTLEDTYISLIGGYFNVYANQRFY